MKTFISIFVIAIAAMTISCAGNNATTATEATDSVVVETIVDTTACCADTTAAACADSTACVK